VDISIQNAISRAICKRKCFYEIFKAYIDTTSVDHTSTSQHGYFISILVEIFEILGPCFMEAIDVFNKGTNSAANIPVLEVEEIDLDAYDKMESAHQSNKSNSQTQCGNCELDSGVDEDHFKLYCFYQDLHDYQQFAKGMWEDFGFEYLDLITASLASDIILAIVHNTNETLVSQHSSTIKITTSFEDMKRLMLVGRPATEKRKWLRASGSTIKLTISFPTSAY
jgi:hypothetical protein